MDLNHTVNALQELLKGEAMAVNIYGRAHEWQKDSEVAKIFVRFHEDHKRHAERLANRIIELGGTPELSTGFAELISEVSTRLNTWRGPGHVLKQIYDSEDKGVNAYEDRINDLDPESRDMVRAIMQEDHNHLKYFAGRLEQEKNGLH